MHYLWDIRLTAIAPAGADLEALSDRLFDALQAVPGIDLWTITEDAAAGTLAAHFGLAVASALSTIQAVQLGIMCFTHAADAIGWAFDNGSVQAGYQPSLEVSYTGRLPSEAASVCYG